MEIAVAQTRFASPHRASLSDVASQRAFLMEDGNLVPLLNAMPQFVMVLNRHRQILLANGELEEYARSQGLSSVVGLRPGELLSCQHAISAESGCGTAEACSTCGAVETILDAQAGETVSRECRVLRKGRNGIEALDLKVWGAPLSWRGEPFSLLAVMDISSEKRRQVLEKIFFHDILNTAGAICNMSELMTRGIMTFEEGREDLFGLAHALIAEIRSQRELLAAENNELQAQMTVLHSRLFLDGVLRTCRNSPAARGRSLSLAEETSSVLFASDETLLGRVLGNLVKNALEASADGETVTVGARSAGGDITFWCHNPGVIPRPVQLQIFLRSFSTKEPGRGIGTYSVKLLTERYLQGEVSFVSTPAEGTTFMVTVPVAPLRPDGERWDLNHGGDAQVH